MKGYWHFPSIAVVAAVFTIQFGHDWFLICFFIWLGYLYFSNRLNKIPVVLSLTCYIFFYNHIPDPDATVPEIADAETKAPVQGKISSEVDFTKTKVEFTLREDSGENVLILYFPPDSNPNGQYAKLKHGASCIVYGGKETPDESRNPGQFNYRDYLLTKGISSQIILSSMEEISCEGASFLNRLYSLRLTLFSYVEDNVSPYTASWLNALVLGDDSDIDEEVIDVFQRWSLSHILAISGLHVGIIVSFVYFLLIKLNIVTKEKAAWIMFSFLPLYAVLAGGEPSVWRASTMVLIFIILNKFKLQLSVTDVLSIVFLLLILIDPNIVYHVGFQLSFTVTFGLLLSRKWISGSNHMLFQALQISFAAQMMILPLLISYFSFFQPLSILLNVMVVPYFSLFVIPLMFIFLITSPFSMLTALLDHFFIFAHEHFLNFIRLVDGYLNYPWVTGSLPLFAVIVYYVFFFLLMFHLEKNNRKKAFIYGVCICLLMASLLIRPYLSPEGRITMLDIGQGDAFVIELPYRKGVVMVDAGARFSFEEMEANKNVYSQIIKPYLHTRGIRKIDAIFISHEDIDHMGSVSFIAEELDLGQILISDYYQLEEETALQWLENNVEIKRISRGDKVEIGGQHFYVLAPIGDQQDENENSLVLYTEAGGKQWLFTGDIGKAQEKDIIAQYPNLSVDVLKVAHHGSDTSSDPTFIDTLNPGYTLIPVGANNAYGHPSSDVIDRLSGTIILRTDNNGAVQFRYRQGEGTFYKFLP